MGRDIQKERLSTRLLPFVVKARALGCYCLREMRPIVEAERLKVFPKSGKLTQTGLYHGLRALREKGLDPGPDDVSTAMRRIVHRKKAARAKGS